MHLNRIEIHIISDYDLSSMIDFEWMSEKTVPERDLVREEAVPERDSKV